MYTVLIFPLWCSEQSTKRVGFFLQHLSKKWASVSVIGKLQLFLAPSSSSLRSSPDGKVPANGPPLSADVSLDTLAPHFDIQASKARPILFLCYSLPVDPTPRLREGSSWACEDLSNLLCGEPQVNLNEPEPLVPLQPQAYTLSPEDASLLRGLPDVSFSLPEGSTNTHNPATPGQSSCTLLYLSFPFDHSLLRCTSSRFRLPFCWK